MGDLWYFARIIAKRGHHKKAQVNKLELKQKLEIGKDKEFKVKVIRDSVVNANKDIESQLLRLYYLVFLKGYPKAKNT